MKVDKNQGYMSQAMRERLDSPVYAYKQWQNNDEKEVQENVLEDFFTFLAEDIEADDPKEEKKIKEALKIFRTALPLFLNVNMDKVKQGEKELLSRWIRSVK